VCKGRYKTNTLKYTKGKINKLYDTIIYKLFNTSLYATFLVTSTRTPLLLQIVLLIKKKMEHMTVQHKVGHD